jgi:hypothetical protein
VLVGGVSRLRNQAEFHRAQTKANHHQTHPPHDQKIKTMENCLALTGKREERMVLVFYFLFLTRFRVVVTIRLALVPTQFYPY